MVSVIIPTYGGGTYLHRTVQSLLAQTDVDLEILVADDNGAGHPNQIATQMLLEPFLALPNFRYLTAAQNAGGSCARNMGARQAQGKYVLFLDDDDALAPGTLHKLVTALEQAPTDCAMAYASAKIFCADTLHNVIRAKKSGDLLYDYLMGRVYMGTGSVLLKRTAWEAAGGYDESFVRHQDWEFFARLLNEHHAVAVPDGFFLRYITNRTTPACVKTAERFADHYIKLLQAYPFRLSARQRKRVINRNNARIALGYLRTGTPKKCVQTLKKYDTIPAALFSLAAFMATVCVDKLTGRKS